MLIVCGDFDARLDKAWWKLQQAELRRSDQSLSQYDLDDICVTRIEQLAGYMEAEARYNRENASKSI